MNRGGFYPRACRRAPLCTRGLFLHLGLCASDGLHCAVACVGLRCGPRPLRGPRVGSGVRPCTQSPNAGHPWPTHAGPGGVGARRITSPLRPRSVSSGGKPPLLRGRGKAAGDRQGRSGARSLRSKLWGRSPRSGLCHELKSMDGRFWRPPIRGIAPDAKRRTKRAALEPRSAEKAEQRTGKKKPRARLAALQRKAKRRIRPDRPASSLRPRNPRPPSRCLRQPPGAGTRPRRRRQP